MSTERKVYFDRPNQFLDKMNPIGVGVDIDNLGKEVML
jgi:hypothetical protein